MNDTPRDVGTPETPALIPIPSSCELSDGDPLVVGDRVQLRVDGAGGVTLGPLVRSLLLGVGVEAMELSDPTSDVAVVELEIEPAADASPESYSLTVTAAGARIAAPSPAGLFHGAQTLAQLLGERSGGAARVPALEIVDAPRFAYRGAMLDVARHFFDVETVERFIDRIALAKLNHLHLHLSDDQGWRIHIDSWPRLTERGATSGVGGSRGGFYTPEDYHRIVAYAAERFITVVPEIDLPGHTHAALVAYPELAPTGYTGAPDSDAAPDEPYTGIEVGFSTVDVTNDAVYRFVADVTRELAALTSGPFLHLGGDESHSTTDAQYLEFLRRAGAVAAETGKTLVFWHEAGRSDELPSGSIGQYWSFVEPRDGAGDLARRFVERGGRVILSPADAVYLDMKHADDDPLGLTWADGPTTVEAAYSWDPAEVVEGIGEAEILGVEAPLWSETIASLAGIDALAFPRILAAAEVAWSRAPGQHPERRWDSFRRRLVSWQTRLDALGVRYTRAEGVEWA